MVDYKKICGGISCGTTIFFTFVAIICNIIMMYMIHSGKILFVFLLLHLLFIVLDLSNKMEILSDSVNLPNVTNEQKEEAVLNNAPVGSILAWVPSAFPGSYNSEVTLQIPSGWQKCDGSLINPPSVLAGQRTPDLNNEKRFLRGSPDETVLSFEDDMVIDHGHDINDPGHFHTYVDTYGHLDENYQSRSGSGLKFKVNSDHDRNTRSQTTGIKVESVSGIGSSQKGSETRPKNMHVTYIMRIF